MEVLGMTPPGNATIVATSSERRRLIKEAVQYLMELIEKDIRPRDIITPEAIDDAFALDMAMGGSTNTVLHTLAIANEAEIEYDLKRINEIAKKVPYLAKISPARTIRCRMFTGQGALAQSLKNCVKWME